MRYFVGTPLDVSAYFLLFLMFLQMFTITQNFAIVVKSFPLSDYLFYGLFFMQRIHFISDFKSET